MIKVGLVGTGYWGPNIARSFELTEKARITWLCDLNEQRLNRIAGRYPAAKPTADISEMLADPDLDAVAISTPASSHFELAQKALLADKHVLVEKPITVKSEDAVALAALADERGRILMVGHVFEYNFTIQALKNLIDSGELGAIYILDFERTNLGPVRTDVNALWDLASHDISIMCYLLDAAPLNVTARGQSFLNSDIEDAVYSTFMFEQGVIAHVHASWLHPKKIRQITAVGSKKMAIWNDLDLQQPVQIYDKRIESPEEIPDTFHAYKTAVVEGGTYIPRIEHNQPLQSECEHFLECVQNGLHPRSDAYSGLRVVSVLEAATESMYNESRLVAVKSDRAAATSVSRAAKAG